MTDNNKYLRKIPSVDEILNNSDVSNKLETLNKESVYRIINICIEETKKTILEGKKNNIRELIFKKINHLIDLINEESPKVIINGTGVILHTNLGRSPISNNAIKSASDVSINYSSLEISPKDGKRGNRNKIISKYLNLSTGCEHGFLVNNNASGTLLTLATIINKTRNEVIVSRGEAVEIGGGFRIPDIMKISGAKLIEVGTTNKTYASDYEKAITKKTAGILKVHTSNFVIKGFVYSTEIKELSEISKKFNIPLIYDIGSGCLVDTTKFGLPKEPMVQESISSGVDITLFSSDKLLGGTQGGIVAGKRNLVKKIETHPLARAFRADKITLTSTISTLRSYIKNSYEEEIPIWQIISQKIEKIEDRAKKICRNSSVGKITDGNSLIGGGSMPEASLPTKMIMINIAGNENEIKTKLMKSSPCVLPRVSEGSIFIDIRTVLEKHDNKLIEILKKLNK